MTSGRALPSKLYFRIGEVADLVGVEPHVLRYWEREFRTIRPTKSAKGQRVYSRRDVENLMQVKDLLYGEGFTIAGARKRMRGKPGAEGEPTDPTEEAPRAVQALSAPISVTAPAQNHSARAEGGEMRSVLEAVKAEIEAFLDELGGA